MVSAVERKLTTVLCADVQGYSRLMELDEEATLDTLRGYREAMSALVERHKGRIVGTAGDSALAEFPSVVEALQCAVEIQRELAARNAALASDRRMNFRIGLNIGDVMVEGEDIYGEGVNVAARLEELAEPGGICISGTVYDQVHNKMSLGYEYLGEQLVKNISEQVPVYRVSITESGAGEFRATARNRTPPPGTPNRDSPLPGSRFRQFFFSASKLSVVVAFLFAIDWLAGEGWWVHWFALIAAFVILLKGLKVLFREEDSKSANRWHAGSSETWSQYKGTIRGDVAFSENSNVRGTIGGTATVGPGIEVNIRGTIERDLVIEKGAVANVRGTIRGDVYNRGGTLNLKGTLQGREVHAEPKPGSNIGKAAAT